MSSPMGRRAVLAVFAVVVAALALLAGCGSGEEASVVSLESAERPATDEPSLDDLADAEDQITDAPYDEGFCDALASVAADPPSDDDPAAGAETMRDLADLAPEELRSDVEVLADALDEYAAVDPNSPEGFGAAFEIFLRPDVIQASAALDLYASDVCGVDLDSNPTDGELPDAETSLPDDGVDGGAGGADIDLEDLDAIEEEAEAAGATWPSKVVGTTIINDVDVTLSADAGDPFTPDEALAACTDVRSALLPRNSGLIVSVENGETPLAAAPAGGECAPA